MATRTQVIIDGKDRTKAAFDSVQRNLGGLKSALAGVGAAVSIAGFGKIVKATLDANDNLAKLAVQTGLTVEQLNDYSLAAQIAGTDTATFSKGVRGLQRNMFDAVAGLKTAGDAFEAMNIELVDGEGNLRDTGLVLEDIADKFSTYRDGAGKAALAQRIFGRAGTQLIPLLNLGSEKLRAYTEENRELGNVLSTQVAQASERVNDNFTRLKTSAQGTARQLTAGLLPALEIITDMFVEFSKGSDSAATNLGEGLGAVLKTIATNVLIIKGLFDAFGKSVGSTAAAIAAAAQGEFSRAWAILGEGGEDVVAEIKETLDGLVKLWGDTAENIEGNAPAQSDKIAAPLVLAEGKIKKSAAAVKDELDLALDLIEGEFTKLDQQEARKIAGLDIEKLSADAQRAAEIFEETRTPAERLTTQIAELNRLFEGGAFGDPESAEAFEVYSRAIFQVQEDFDALNQKATESTSELSTFADQAARNMQDSFANFLFDPFSDGLEGMISGFVDSLRRMASEAAAAAIFESLGVEDLLKTGLSAFFPTRALGGPVAGGKPYLVGEHGAEVVVPRQAGAVVPNNQLGGMPSVTINMNNAPGADTGSPSQTGYQIGRAIQDYMRRNG